MSPERKPSLTLEFLTIMTVIGVAVAVLVLIIDQQIKRDIITHATAARESIDEFLSQVRETSHGPAAPSADSAN